MTITNFKYTNGLIIDDVPYKLEGYYKNIPVYSSPLVQNGIIYMISQNATFSGPKKKNGKPDMRYGINRLLSFNH